MDKNNPLILKYVIAPFIIIIMISSAGYSARTWQYYHAKGALEYKSEMYDFALENLERSIELNPSDFEAANMMAEIYLIKNKQVEAIDYFDKSLEVNNNQPDIHCKAGALREFYLQYEKAFNHYLKAVEADPSHVNGHLNLIRMYTRKNDRAGAIRQFDICHGIGKAEGEKYYNLALGQEKINENEAIRLYKTSIEKNPALIESYFKLADIYRARSDPDTAVSFLKKITEIRPDNERAFIQLGHLHLQKALAGTPLKTGNVKQRLFQFEKARTSFETALRLNPENTELYSCIADIYNYMGNTDKAQELYEKISSIENKTGRN